MARLKELYQKEVAPALMKKYAYKSPMEIPRFDKVVVNVGCGEARENSKVLENVVGDLSQITGQKPIITRARKSIANFKLREDMPIGAKVTLKAIESICNDVAAITGQKPVVVKAKKSVANFKLREGMPVGVKVTLRGDRMFEFIDRLFNVALPRVRDFRGINANGFDGRGNYAFGLREQLIFPEIEYDKVDQIRGMDIAFVTTAKTDEEARELLTLMGAPFAK